MSRSCDRRDQGTCLTTLIFLVLLLHIIFFRGTMNLYRRCPNLQGMETQPSCQEKVLFFIEMLLSCHGQHEHS